MRRWVAVALVLILVIAVGVFGLVYADSRVTTTHHGPGKTGVAMSLSAYARPDSLPYSKITHSKACSKVVTRRARRHHVSTATHRRVNRTVCYRKVTHSKPKIHKADAAQLRAMGVSAPLVAEGPVEYTEQTTESCGLSCHLWHVRETVLFFHDNTQAWVHHYGYDSSFIRCDDYGGVQVDITVQNCGWSETKALASWNPAPAPRSPFLRGQEDWELVVGITWAHASVHDSQWMDCYPSGHVRFGDHLENLL